MKEVFLVGLICLLSTMLMSWGCLGHEAVGLIAERHLTARARAAVNYYLDSQSISGMSMWADEIRIEPQYRYTGTWHLVNLPSGLSYAAFREKLVSLPGDNIYTALVQCEQDLVNPGKSREEKSRALKFIVHLVGDLHQPLHVSRAEDRSGNKIQVSFEGKSTDLHALWDIRLLEHSRLNAEQLARRCDRADSAQIREWQEAPLVQWFWESYQVCSRLYEEVDQMNRRVLTEAYYQKHLPILEEQIEKAGIRLAGVLNKIFETATIPDRPALNR